MKEVEANKTAWGLLSKDHYEYCKKALQEKKLGFSKIIEREIGDISGKTVIHLQCNAGADTILLAQKGAIVTGVDLVPENIKYARKKIVTILSIIITALICLMSIMGYVMA